MSDAIGTEAVCETEGGNWIPIEAYKADRSIASRRVHAIKFTNGVIWDAVNGFRTPWPAPPPPKPGPITNINSPEWKTKCMGWALEAVGPKGHAKVIEAAKAFYAYVYEANV